MTVPVTVVKMIANGEYPHVEIWVVLLKPRTLAFVLASRPLLLVIVIWTRKKLCDASQWKTPERMVMGIAKRNGTLSQYVSRCRPMGDVTRRGLRSLR
jgi:hypothetical protein